MGMQDSVNRREFFRRAGAAGVMGAAMPELMAYAGGFDQTNITHEVIAPGPEIFYVPSYAYLPAAEGVSAGPHGTDLLFVGARNNFNVDGIIAFLEANAGWLGGRRIAIAGKVCDDPAVAALARSLSVRLLAVNDHEEVRSC